MNRCLLALAASTMLFHPLRAGAEDLGAKELRKLQRQADKSYKAGKTEQAVAAYERILGAVPAGDSRRGDALYVVAMAHLSTTGGDRDVDPARSLLDELATDFPRHSRNLEISAARALIDDLDTARAELEATMAAIDAERQKAEAEREEVADESEAVDGKVKALQQQLRRARSQLAETQTDLDRKEEALQKLKDALVGRTGG